MAGAGSSNRVGFAWVPRMLQRLILSPLSTPTHVVAPAKKEW